MAKSETIRARMEPELKAQAEAVLDELGLNTTEAITLFFRQIVLRRGLPFEVKIPNATTRRAIEQARAGKGLTRYPNAKSLLDEHS